MKKFLPLLMLLVCLFVFTVSPGVNAAEPTEKMQASFADAKWDGIMR